MILIPTVSTSQPHDNSQVTRSQLQERAKYMMSMVTADFTPFQPHNAQPKGKYAMAAQCIASGQYVPPSHSHHFVGAVVDDDSNTLEYRHLIKMEKHKVV